MLNKVLNQEIERISIWKAREIMDKYRDNRREITNEVIKAYQACSQFGRTSYSLMESLVGEEIAKEIVKLDKIF